MFVPSTRGDLYGFDPIYSYSRTTFEVIDSDDPNLAKEGVRELTIIKNLLWRHAHMYNNSLLPEIDRLASLFEIEKMCLRIAPSLLIHVGPHEGSFYGVWKVRNDPSCGLQMSGIIRANAVHNIDPRFNFMGASESLVPDFFLYGELTAQEALELQEGLFPVSLQKLGLPDVAFGPGKISPPPSQMFAQQGLTPVPAEPSGPKNNNDFKQLQEGGRRRDGLGFSSLAKDNGTRFLGNSKPDNGKGRADDLKSGFGFGDLAKDNGTRFLGSFARGAGKAPDRGGRSRDDEEMGQPGPSTRGGGRRGTQYGNEDYDSEDDKRKTKFGQSTRGGGGGGTQYGNEDYDSEDDMPQKNYGQSTRGAGGRSTRRGY